MQKDLINLPMRKLWATRDSDLMYRKRPVEKVIYEALQCSTHKLEKERNMGKDDYGERRAHGGKLPGAPCFDTKKRCSVCNCEATQKIRYYLPGLDMTSLAFTCDTCEMPRALKETEEKV